MIFKFSSGRQHVDYALNYISDVYHGNYSLETKLNRYLFKYQNESNDAFFRRQRNTVFHNYLKSIINNVAEKPFASSVTYDVDFPKQLEPYKKHFDFTGDGIFQSAYKAMVGGLRDGLCLFVSDMDENGVCFSRRIPAYNIIGCWTDMDNNGKKFISRVQFMVQNYKAPKPVEDPSLEDQESEETTSAQVYDMQHPNIVDIYEVDKKDGENYLQNTLNNYDYDYGYFDYNYQNQGSLDAQNSTNNLTNRRYGIVKDVKGTFLKRRMLKNFERLPAHLFITGDRVNENNILKVIPLFYDLSRLNIQHFNKKSDQDYIMSISRFAILAGSGVNTDTLRDNIRKVDKDRLSIGPNMLLLDKNPSAKYYFVEHSGSAIESGMKDILTLEQTMTSMLTKYLEKVHYETATAKTIEDTQKKLYSLYLSNLLEDIFSDILKDFATYKGYNVKTENKLINFSKDYNPLEVKIKINTLLQARKMGEITSETFLNELEGNNIFSNSFNVDDELEKLDEINSNLMEEEKENPVKKPEEKK